MDSSHQAKCAILSIPGRDSDVTAATFAAAAEAAAAEAAASCCSCFAAVCLAAADDVWSCIA